MNLFKLDHEILQNGTFPPFSVTIQGSCPTAIVSETEIQTEFIQALQNIRDVRTFDFTDGLYERLTVEQNIAFYHKWFGCSTPLSEILVMFELYHCAKIPLRKSSESEIRRVHFAKYLMSGASPMIFREPVHGVDVLTTHSFLTMLKQLTDRQIPVLILVSNLEHALLLGDVTYKLQENGLHEVEMDGGEKEAPGLEESTLPTTADLFKIPAKVDDKVILFDPTEIDYIESQDGKSMIVINQEFFAMDSTLAEVEKKLEVYGFYRCHRSYIVNLQKVREIITWSKNKYSLRIANKDQSTIPLSRTKIQEIHEIFNLK